MLNDDDQERINEKVYEQEYLNVDSEKELPQHCPQCLGDISLKTDDYHMVVHYTKKGQTGDTYSEFYHLECWKKRKNGQ
jgi:hypothetical protein